MKVIIAGSRTLYPTLDEISDYLIEADFRLNLTEVICGMAKGVDLQGKLWAERAKIPVAKFPANWNKHGRSAGAIRNKMMAEDADALLLIWDGKSRGSKNMLDNAETHRLLIKEVINGEMV